MVETIPATEANRHFSRVLREVRQGKTFIVTIHGRPVARIEPVDDAFVAAQEAERAQRAEAWKALFDRIESQPIRKIGPWTRDELYEDEP